MGIHNMNGTKLWSCSLLPAAIKMAKPPCVTLVAFHDEELQHQISTMLGLLAPTGSEVPRLYEVMDSTQKKKVQL